MEQGGANEGTTAVGEKTRMPKHKNRRDFLRDTTLIAAGAVGGLAGGLFPLGSSAIEPVRRAGPAKFKVSCAGYSYR